MPWEYDPDVKMDYKPSELFPVRHQFRFLGVSSISQLEY
jgi:hypothetical protein